MKNKFYFTIIFISVFLSSSALAYVFTRNSSGTTLRLNAPASPLFVVNWNNANGLGYTQIFNSLTRSLQRWKNIGTADIGFSYIQGSSYPADWGADGQNAVFFSSQSPSKLGGGVLGTTYLFSSAGKIIETDIEFNDESFIFSTNPSDSSQVGDFRHVFLENVATHEFGHAYGLTHSAVLQSSMVFLESRGQAKPSCDDQLGLAEAYPVSGFHSDRGLISGSVLSGATAVFGAHVLVVSKTRNTVVAGALTDSSGNFSVSGLEPGNYYLMLEPFQMASPISSLCGGAASNCAYGGVNSKNICAGSPFKRSFVESSPGVLQTYGVVAGGNTRAGSLSINCSALSDPWSSNNQSVASAPTVLSNNAGVETQSAVWGVAGAVGTYQYYLLHNVSGNISVGAMSYSIYSPMDIRVTLLDSSGTTVASGTVSTDNVFSNSSSYTNYDSEAMLSSAAPGDYYIRVHNAGDLSQNRSLYPAGSVGASGSNPQVDNVKYYLLNIRINDSTSLLPSTLNPVQINNARCERPDTFSTYPDYGAPPPSAGSPPKDVEKSSGCGTIRPVEDKTERGFSFSALMNSIWVFALAFGLSRLAVRLAMSRFHR